MLRYKIVLFTIISVCIISIFTYAAISLAGYKWVKTSDTEEKIDSSIVTPTTLIVSSPTPTTIIKKTSPSVTPKTKLVSPTPKPSLTPTLTPKPAFDASWDVGVEDKAVNVTVKGNKKISCEFEHQWGNNQTNKTTLLADECNFTAQPTSGNQDHIIKVKVLSVDGEEKTFSQTFPTYACSVPAGVSFSFKQCPQ